MRKLNLTALLAMTFIANVGYGMDLPDDAGATPAVTAGGTDGDDFVVIPRRRNRAQEARLAAEDALRATIVSAQINFFETPTERQGHYSVHFRALKEALSTPQYQEKLFQDTFVAMTVLLENQSDHGAISDTRTLEHINKALELQKLFESGINRNNQEQRRSERKWNFHLGRAISLYLKKLPEPEEGEDFSDKQGLLEHAVELFKKSHENRGYPASKTPLLHAGELLASVFLVGDEGVKSAQLLKAKSFLDKVCTPKASPTKEEKPSVFFPPKTPSKLKRERSDDAVPEAKGDVFKNQAARLLRHIEEALSKANVPVEEDEDSDVGVAASASATALPPPPPPVDDVFAHKRSRASALASPAASSGLSIDTNPSGDDSSATPSSRRAFTVTSRKKDGNLKKVLGEIGKTEADLPALLAEHGSYKNLGASLNITTRYLRQVIGGLDKSKIEDLDHERLEELNEILRNIRDKKITKTKREVADEFGVQLSQVEKRYRFIIEENQRTWRDLDESTKGAIRERVEAMSISSLALKSLSEEFNVKHTCLYMVFIQSARRRHSATSSSSFDDSRSSSDDDDSDSDRVEGPPED